MGFFGGVGVSIIKKTTRRKKKVVGSRVVLREDELLFTFSVLFVSTLGLVNVMKPRSFTVSQR